jgi:hypothetical protein
MKEEKEEKEEKQEEKEVREERTGTREQGEEMGRLRERRRRG